MHTKCSSSNYNVHQQLSLEVFYTIFLISRKVGIEKKLVSMCSMNNFWHNFFSSLVLRILAVSNVYVTLSNTCRHDGFHRYEQFLYILGGCVLLKSLIYKPKFIEKISLCSLETGEKTAGSERRRKKHTGF